MHIVKGKKVSWIDIHRPTKDDIEYLRKTYKFHPVILEELKQPSFRARVEHYDDYLFLVFHMPHYDFATRTSVKREIDFLITKDSIITVHHDRLEAFEIFERTLEKNANVRERAFEKSSGVLLYYLVNSIHDFSIRQLHHIEEKVGSLTKDILGKNEYEMLERISYAKREILDYQIISEPQKILLDSLREVGLQFWGENLRIYLTDLIGDQAKIAQRLETYSRIVESLENTNTQLLSTHTNTIMQRFTILAFLTFPIVLYTGFFSPFFEIQPGPQTPVSPKIFLIGLFALFVIIVCIAGTLIALKKKRWF